MAKFNTGDLVVLKSGSMRMCVENAGDEQIDVVWCHEGAIGRDSFDPELLNKWEHREEERGERPARKGPPRGADRERREERGDRTERGREERGREERPRRTGWDGKPRERKYFRKDEG